MRRSQSPSQSIVDIPRPQRPPQASVIISFISGVDVGAHAAKSIIPRCGHTLVLQPREICRVDSRAAVFDNAADGFRAREHSANENISMRVIGSRYRLRSIDLQVHDHPLELDAIAGNLRQVRRQIARNRDTLDLNSWRI